MKVKVTLDFDDEVRRALNNQLGKKGPMSREGLRNWVDDVVTATLDDIMEEYHDKPSED